MAEELEAASLKISEESCVYIVLACSNLSDLMKLDSSGPGRLRRIFAHVKKTCVDTVLYLPLYILRVFGSNKRMTW